MKKRYPLVSGRMHVFFLGWSLRISFVELRTYSLIQMSSNAMLDGNILDQPDGGRTMLGSSGLSSFLLDSDACLEE